MQPYRLRSNTHKIMLPLLSMNIDIEYKKVVYFLHPTGTDDLLIVNFEDLNVYLWSWSEWNLSRSRLNVKTHTNPRVNFAEKLWEFYSEGLDSCFISFKYSRNMKSESNPVLNLLDWICHLPFCFVQQSTALRIFPRYCSHILNLYHDCRICASHVN